MNKYLKSPFNYIGGKTKIIKRLLEIFPDDISTFVEPFCGGYNVGLNVDAENIVEIEINKYLIELFQFMRDTKTESLISQIEELVAKYELSKTNQEGYLKLRKEYNSSKNPLLLFVLICFSFNHQIRFNNSFQFNTPFGKERSSYNTSIKNNLIAFSERMKKQNIKFINGDFENFDYESLDSNSFVYCDPPYMITTGSYNDGTRGFGDWTLKSEKRLLNLLDSLDRKGIKFALSNVLYHNGSSNDLLIEWSKKYNIHFIDTNYNNSNYHSKAKEHDTVEVVITNYGSKI